MKCISLNCNGFRSAMSKGMINLIQTENPDIVALQEVKAEEHQMDLSEWKKMGYEMFLLPAEKKGYSGVAIFTKKKPKNTIFGLSDEIFDREGRHILLDFGSFAFMNTYFPSGTSGDERQSLKMKFLDLYSNQLSEWKTKYKKLIICGDVNIAHTEIDIHNPKGNQKNSGFLPEEREWLSQFLAKGMIDCFRYLNPEKLDEYSWWTYRFNARSNNKGWRIDYFFVTENLRSKLIHSEIKKEPILSDHAPIVLEIQL